ncbi:MAG: glycerol kinase GlpK [Chitinophagaceae bacterium]|nr:glycerol kinase GlpK [Chitinophagaceae bacterium]
MQQYILAIDQGTTSSRSLIFDANCRIVSLSQKEFTQHFPQPERVEHDATEILNTQLHTIREAIQKAGLSVSQIAAIGITNQRETTVVWNRKTGQPVCPAIVWQDRRTADYCTALKQQGAENLIQQKTGLVIDAYFSATKLKWILEHVPDARIMAEKGELAFGTIDSWLIWNLTGGKVHATDASNASRTMLYNIHTLQWDEELLQLFGIPAAVLPEVKNSIGIFGYTDASLLGSEIPIAAVAGDQQAALFGQLCWEPGMVKNTYGTGCFMLMNTGSQPVPSGRRLLTTVAWQQNGETTYALEGSVFIAGALVQWLRDGLQLISRSSEIQTLASQAPHANGIYIVPAFTGLGAPYWNPHARGAIFGLTRGAQKSHIARAALESIAYQNYDVLKAMEADAGIAVKELRVDGGATVNDLLMQFQCDILNCKTVRPAVTETTAQGVAFMAGLAVSFWSSAEEIRRLWQAEKIFFPSMPDEQRKQHLLGWQRAVQAALAWSNAATD